ncbi:MAG: CPBP family intramembrane glutamic endopeptidase [Candidatus Hodarchaeota archaeon]
MVRVKSPLKHIFRTRIYFLIEILILIFGIYFLLLLIQLLPIIIEPNSILFGPLYFMLRAIFLVLGIMIFLYVANFALQSKRKLIVEEISSTKNFIKLFSISKSNFKYQLMYGFLLLFLVFIPLDFLQYLVLPKTLDFLSMLLTFSVSNSYLLTPYFTFLVSVLIIQFSIALHEESFVRGFLTNRGSDYVPKMSAVIISSFFWGLQHFAYILHPLGRLVPLSFLLNWFIQAFIIGIILALFILRKRWIFPVIFSHAVNNIITAHTIWNHVQGNGFTQLAILVYTPLILISLTLFIWQFSRIKESLLNGLKEFKSYFSNDKSIKETSMDKIIRIMLDFLFGLIIFAVAIIVL